MRLGFLGLGVIASAVAKSVAQDGHEIVVSPRNAAHAAALSSSFASVTVAENQAILDRADVLFIGVTADAAPEALAPLTFRPAQTVISFMVGLPTERLEALIAPARLETIMIPFPSIAEGGSPILACPQSDVVEALFEPRNTVISLPDEAALNAFLAAQAVLSPVVKMLATGVDWLADRTGDRHGSEQFLRLLVGGSLMARPMTERDVLATLIEALNTPGGLNRQFREFMDAEGVFDATERGLDVLATRLATQA